MPSGVDSNAYFRSSLILSGVEFASGLPAEGGIDGEVFPASEAEIMRDVVPHPLVREHESHGLAFKDPGASIRKMPCHFFIERGPFRGRSHDADFFIQGVEFRILEKYAIAAFGVRGIKKLEEVFRIGIVPRP